MSPIRTLRGRSAAYRQMLGWPERSPLHLFATAVVVVLVLLLVATVGLLLSGGGEPGTAAAAPAPSRATAPPATTTSASDDSPSFQVPLARGQAPADAPTVADIWVRAFLTVPDGITPGAWLDQLRPWTTEEQLTLLETVDPLNVPVAAVVGPPQVVRTEKSSVVVDVPTSAAEVAKVRVLLVHTPAGWRVSHFGPAS